MKKSIYLSILFIALSFLFSDCKKESEGGSFFNIFSVEDDKQLGLELSQEIASNPTEYPILDPAQYATAYTHMNRFRDDLLNTGLVNYANEFAWDFKIIAKDDVINAFAVPGGYCYFYTGLIKYLDNEAQFSGVVAHEMAHVALRHSTTQLTKVYGVQFLLSMLVGENPGALTEIAAGLATGLATLAFSRSHEYEADEFAVKYNYDTEWDARGVGGFFEKLESASVAPVFLSTHPSPDDRYDQILATWNSLGGKTGNENSSRYQDFINSLP